MQHQANEKPPTRKLLTLLHVDDNADDRFLVARSVNQLPVTLTEAASGAEALRTLAESPQLPDIIMLDIRMPLMSGFEVLEHLKTADRFSSIPVIIFSNSAYSEDVHRARQLGADSYCVKPTGITEYKQLLHDIYNSWLNSESLSRWPTDTPV
jgi:CheY-like chemotaxis protein